MKKTISIILITLIILMFSNLPTYAMGFTIDLKADKNVVSAGSTISVTVSTNNLNIGGEGMNVFSCLLQYDETMFEKITLEDIKGLNNWSVSYNAETGKILLDNSNFITVDSELCVITFKVKSNVELESTEIKIADPQTSNNKVDISGTEGTLTVHVKQLASDKYIIDEDNTIKGVSPNTSADELKENLIGGETVTIVDKNGNEINSGDIGTGSVVKTESGEEYTVIVKGDINGDGKVSTTDLSQLKLHVVESKILQDPYKSAGDINLDGKVTITDVAQLKLVIVGNIEL